jgi:hypothetical protein
VLQQLSAISQSYGVDTAAYQNFKFGFAMTQYGEKMAGDITVASMGARGMRGGDLDGMYLRDMSYVVSGGAGDGLPAMSFDYKLALMTLEDMRLGKVMEHLAKGVFPPRTETNLMSLGVWRTQNESMKIADKQIYSLEESSFDATGWHWFIPTKLQSSAKNVKLDIGAFLELGQQFSAMAYDPYGYDEPVDPAQTAAELQAVRDLLNKHGLSTPTFNSNFGWNWNAGNGDGRLDLSIDGDSLLKVDAKYEGGFPSFKAVSDLIPENPENTDAMALSNLFQSGTTLKLIEFNVQDKGGLPKIYGMIGEYAPMMGLGPSAMSAEDVRMLAANGVETMGIMAGQQIPEVPALLTPVVNFLKSGGKLRLAVQPSKATPFASLAGTMMGVSMGAASPSQVIKELGLKTEHSK